jgi:hypothetical protein
MSPRGKAQPHVFPIKRGIAVSKRFWLPAILISSTLVTGPVTAAEPPITQAAAASIRVGDPVSEAQFAWLLFMQAVQPTNGMLAFETWTEQCQLNPSMAGCPSPSATAAAGRTRMHGSALLQSIRRKTGNLAGLAVTQNGVECNAMQTAPLNGYSPPSNLSLNPTFCEEVFVNASERDFIAQGGLNTLSGQQAYGGKNGNAVAFPWSAIEVKADWVPTSSFTGPTFSCPDKNLYTETINGTCYALVGLHISSKARPDWVWATFEPASSITNPNRCDPNLYSACFDPWGTISNAPYGKGQTVPQSPQLQQLMAAVSLNPVFSNYYLTGVQTQFVDGNSKPIPLGSSFVEFNAGVNPGQASCITCHKYAYFDGKDPGQGKAEDNFGGAPTGWPSVGYACNNNQNGNCTPFVPNSTSQDFSWILGLMPFN